MIDHCNRNFWAKLFQFELESLMFNSFDEKFEADRSESFQQAGQANAQQGIIKAGNPESVPPSFQPDR